jgi:tRNA-specific 2-thiouridylase
VVSTGSTDAIVEIDLHDPAQGIAPGQAAVIYDGTRVVGSATIVSTARVAVP